MYIRTRTGNVLYDVMLNVKWTAKIDNGLKYYDFDGDYAGLVICENNFKSQGDNLIDVLEVNDLVISNNSVQIVKYRNGEGLVVLNYYAVDDTSEIDGLKEEHLKHYKIITHEQYMKLAQEVT